MRDKLDEAYLQIYGWKMDESGELLPPYFQYPLPDFVLDRIEWVSKEARRTPMTLAGGIHFLRDINNEKQLKEEWDWGAASEYLPVTKEYKEWLEDYNYSEWRQIIVGITYVYWQGRPEKKQGKESK